MKGTEDPNFFASGIGGEYRLVDVALSQSSSGKITAVVIDAAFVEPGAEEPLRAHVQQGQAHRTALQNPTARAYGRRYTAKVRQS